jgi:lipoprotein-anchoring transpeptidase ErfK/SrfK
VLGSSLAVTLIAVLGGSGLLPSLMDGDRDRGGSAAAAAGQVTTPSVEPTADVPDETALSDTADTAATGSEVPVDDTALPADSGTGKRVVFSESRQRVWLVTGAKKVQRSYLVSGSVYDNLDPGTYSVYSRSEQAWGIDDSGTMKYFVRFTQGENAAIGFHSIPVDDGKPVQSVAQLGTPLSHGCIRQKHADALALWDFAPLGTTVVVTA